MQAFSWILLTCWLVTTACWVLLTRELLAELKRRRRKRAATKRPEAKGEETSA